METHTLSTRRRWSCLACLIPSLAADASVADSVATLVNNNDDGDDDDDDNVQEQCPTTPAAERGEG